MRRGLWFERKAVPELARKEKWFEQSSGVRSGVHGRDAQIGLGRLGGREEMPGMRPVGESLVLGERCSSYDHYLAVEAWQNCRLYPL